ncbi:TIP41-domain-containing protein [Tilletiaria anomala UBC 951]|uniref:TIP41-domain-containing protein n=1 Tax=Tilletiaria anomala (strain ATCC 24038 / CBS 436.72 / UBC 951) TaxID=1037660 RepID=A0A066VVQ3_TILAU|nr:TIP41-domain-containing protein [Tilletiaria anomala UBC 951]KDN45581.1 TIP41-domain-containing protein [Tilletiaria anomala UBC 951]
MPSSYEASFPSRLSAPNVDAGVNFESESWQWQDKNVNGVDYRVGHKVIEHEQPTASLTPASATTSQAGQVLPQIKIEHKAIHVAGWTVTAVIGPIGNAQEMDEMADLLGIPPPEMVFPHNSLTLHHEPTDTYYTLNATDALCSINGVHPKNKGKGKLRNPGASTELETSLLKVSYAKEWGKNRSQGGTMPLASNSRKYDWTYSCTWAGSLSSGMPSSESAEGDFVPASHPTQDRIPVERLGAGSEPILFFNEMVLFEDELGDNGTSVLSIKVRVMPSCLLVLQRFFLRVDKVAFRIFDTRLFVPFSTGAFAPNPAHSCRIIRDLQGVQWPYDALRAKLPPYRPNDLSPLTDPNWVAQIMTKSPTHALMGDQLPPWQGESAVVECLQR